jgi:4-hydroxyphenylpyruvate dioxygenase
MLPGIGSPSGLHLFVSDTHGHQDHWQRDFRPEPGTSAGTLLGTFLGIDHVAVSVPPYRLNEEIAFFRTLFGLMPGTREEFMDPHGRLRSLALRPSEGDLRIVLNVSEAAQEVSQPHGVTQVAFRCDDVVAAVEDLGSRGVPFMPVPENYYVDLDARFGLDADVLDDLRRHQLMYDRVGDGELVHAYTGALATGFHVEILERRGGYDAYGSANTFVRLAAQATSKARQAG